MRYICSVCGYVYDEAAEQLPFSSLPDDWKCPLCRAGKELFRAETENAVTAETAGRPLPEISLTDLSAGRLSIICSSLARGCEKQYRTEEVSLFRELAEYFRTITPAPENADLNDLAGEIHKDADHYRNVRAAADAEGDRGTARICVWGEKVTRMLGSLTDRYLKEGEDMLADTGVWVCSVCGFVYTGDEAPDLCPVCKVPAWKFDKVEGGRQV